MSYQVGPVCYSTVVHAGGAACAAFNPVTTLTNDGTVVRTVSCSGVDQDTGALLLLVSSKAVDNSTETSTTMTQTVAFADCQYPAFVKAGMAISGALLSAVVIAWCWWKVADFINNTGRADT